MLFLLYFQVLFSNMFELLFEFRLSTHVPIVEYH